MSSNRKLAGDILSADADSFIGLKTIGDYNPSNPLYTVNAIQNIESEMRQLQTQCLQLQNQLAAVTDTMIKKEWEFHELIIGAKTSVQAQYGRDSNELQSVGKKKISEYKKKLPRKADDKSVKMKKE